MRRRSLAPQSRTAVELARHLLEVSGGHTGSTAKNSRNSRTPRTSPAPVVCDRLRDALTAFVGVAGFQSLLSRALLLASAKQPALLKVRVLDDGTLSKFDQIGKDSGDRRFNQQDAAGEALIVHLLDLLTLLIGEPLMIQILRGAWPGLPARFRSRSEDTP